MLNYDLELFSKTYDKLTKTRSFKHIFQDVFIPLLTEIGLLWQTDTINPTHEHFITNLIKQKLLTNIEKLQFSHPTNTEKSFVLFLPENEIHELGLLYINYEILLKGYKAVYLGPSIPLDCLTNMIGLNDKTVFVSYFTIKPEKDKISDYVQEFNTIVARDHNTEFWMLGKQIMHVSQNSAPNHRYFNSINDLLLDL